MTELERNYNHAQRIIAGRRVTFAILKSILKNVVGRKFEPHHKLIFEMAIGMETGENFDTTTSYNQQISENFNFIAHELADYLAADIRTNKNLRTRERIGLFIKHHVIFHDDVEAPDFHAYYAVADFAYDSPFRKTRKDIAQVVENEADLFCRFATLIAPELVIEVSL